MDPVSVVLVVLVVLAVAWLVVRALRHSRHSPPVSMRGGQHGGGGLDVPDFGTGQTLKQGGPGTTRSTRSDEPPA
jgi:hypothetical protein